jgi:hypothetical protein
LIAYLGANELRLTRGDELLVAEHVEGRDEALSRLETALASAPRGLALTVLLSGAYSQPFLLPVVDGAVTASDWEAIALASVESRTSLGADAAIWLDARQQAPRLAVAMDGALKRSLEAIAGKRAMSLRPWWADALNATGTSASAGVALLDSDALTVMLGDDAVYSVAETRLLDGAPPRALLNRMLISLGRVDELPLIAMTPLGKTSSGESVPFLSEVAA